MSTLTLLQPATTAQQPRDARARDDARLADQLAQARRAAADAERAADVRPVLAQAPNGGVVTNSDQEGTQQTTISRDGRQTIISTDKNGVTRITGEDGHVTVIDPQAIASQAAQAATTAVAAAPMPIPFPPDQGIPDSIVRLVVIVLFILAMTIIGFPISRAFARRMDRKAAGPGPIDSDVVRRLDRIEQAIETMAVEMERVSEAQRYSAKLLTDRLPETPARAIAGAEQLTR